MGSFIELNDTLQIITEQGFPNELNLERHKQNPFTAENFKGKIFEFCNKRGARIYHQSPTRCFLVHNINSKWLYWGKVLIIEQTIKGEDKENHTTSGKYKIIEIYHPEYQEQITKHESPEGLSYL
ncbi:MAG: hypothetical protein NT076_04515 [Candidatus Pacearchaeota archaeon]|nr:hypothetical protein [Candidatus Pacearchaeota archaeon]